MEFLSEYGHRILGTQVRQVEQGVQETELGSDELEVFTDAKDSSISYSALVDILLVSYASRSEGIIYLKTVRNTHQRHDVEIDTTYELPVGLFGICLYTSMSRDERFNIVVTDLAG